jgi:hypothetical protein
MNKQVGLIKVDLVLGIKTPVFGLGRNMMTYIAEECYKAVFKMGTKVFHASCIGNTLIAPALTDIQECCDPAILTKTEAAGLNRATSDPLYWDLGEGRHPVIPRGRRAIFKVGFVFYLDRSEQLIDANSYYCMRDQLQRLIAEIIKTVTFADLEINHKVKGSACTYIWEDFFASPVDVAREVVPRYGDDLTDLPGIIDLITFLQKKEMTAFPELVELCQVLKSDSKFVLERIDLTK